MGTYNPEIGSHLRQTVEVNLSARRGAVSRSIAIIRSGITSPEAHRLINNALTSSHEGPNPQPQSIELVDELEAKRRAERLIADAQARAQEGPTPSSLELAEIKATPKKDESSPSLSDDSNINKATPPAPGEEPLDLGEARGRLESAYNSLPVGGHK